MAFDSSMFQSGLGGLLGGIFGDSGKPYDEAMNQYQKYMQMGQSAQQPYLDAGKQGLGNYQEWLQGQKDPAAFLNNLMGQYQQSPYNSYLQKQAQNAGINAGSASGLTGSSALMQQMQQNAANIGQQGMDTWLQNALGINTQYGQGQNNLVQGGQNATNSLMNMLNQMSQQMGDAAYGKEAGKQSDLWNTIGGGLSLLGSIGIL